MAWVLPDAEVAAGLKANPQVIEACAVIAGEVAAEARSIARAEAYRSGEYERGIVVVRDHGEVRVRATAEHSAPLESGTGLYGPKRKVIRAKRGKGFAFTSRTGKQVFVTEIRGMPGKHIIDRACAAAAAASPGLRYRRIRPWVLTP
jgi:hypothetical protein